MKRLHGLTAAILSMACCASPPLAVTMVPIGAVIDSTGSIARPSWRASLQLAGAQMNDALEKRGASFRFTILHSDSTNTPSVAVEGALILARDQKVLALLTDTSADTIAINKLGYDADGSNDLNLPLICQACTSPSINNPAAVDPDPVTQAALRDERGWLFRATMTSDPQAIVLMNIALRQAPLGTPPGDANGDGKFKYTAMAIDDSYGNGFVEGLRRAAAALSLSPPAVLERLSHPRDANPDTYPWAELASKVVDDVNENLMPAGTVDGRPDIAFEVDFPQFATSFTQAYLQTGAPIRLLHTHNFRADGVIARLGSSLNGQEGSSHVLLDNGASGEVFAAALKIATGKSPGLWDSNTYDGAVMLMLSIIQALHTSSLTDPNALTGEQIKSSLHELDAPSAEVVRTGADEFARAIDLLQAGTPINFEGASGPMDFDAQGNVLDRVARYRFENGAFVDVEKYDCVTSPTTCPLMP